MGEYLGGGGGSLIFVIVIQQILMDSQKVNSHPQESSKEIEENHLKRNRVRTKESSLLNTRAYR